MQPESDIKQVVKQQYGQAANRVAQGVASRCCGAQPGGLPNCDPITSNLYDRAQAGDVPDKALEALRAPKSAGVGRFWRITSVGGAGAYPPRNG